VELSRRRFLQLTAGVGAVAAFPAFRTMAQAADGIPEGVWLAGDFHCHSVYSHDVWGGPGDDNTGYEEFYTHGFTVPEQILVAESRGLNFLAITDHNRVRSVHDPGYASDNLVLVPGYEHSLSGGHAGVFVPTVDQLDALFALTGNGDGSGKGFAGDSILDFFKAVADNGAISVVNHPFANGSRTGMDWTRTLEHTRHFTAVEAWNSAWANRGEVMPQVETDSDLAVQWWEENLALTHGIVGGSDNHWKLLTAVAGIGQPTTWVYARNASAEAVIEAVAAGRTFVAAQPPLMGGSQAFLTVAEPGGAPEMVGGKVCPGVPLEVRVDVRNAPAAVVRIIANGEVLATTRTLLPNDEVSFDGIALAKHGTLRAEVYDHAGMLMRVVTSAIRAGDEGGDAAPSRGTPVTYEAFGQPSFVPPQACECSHH
jgi:hypothetical protein